MVSCKNCNNVFDESFGVCPKCGTVYVPDANPVAAEPQYMAFQNEAQMKEKAAGKKGSAGKKIAIIAVLIAVIIGAVLTIILVIAGSKNSQAVREQMSLGEKYMSDEDYDEAIIAFEKAIEIDPNNIDAYKKLAEAYKAVGNYTGSIRALRRGYERTGNGELKSLLDEYTLTFGLENSIKDAKVSENGSINGLTYTIYDNGVTVIDGNGYLPDTDKDNVIWKNKKVTEVYLKEGVSEIGRYAFRDCDTITSIHIPRSVTKIGEWAFNECDRLTSIEVDPDNNYYTSVDGVLYNKEKTTLEAYPSGRAGSYTLPYTVTDIMNWAFAGCKNLTYISVENGIEAFRSDDGVLYTKEYKALVAYPAARNGDAVYNINENVTEIRPHAFYKSSNLEVIVVPASVKNVMFHAFEGLTADQTIFLSGRKSVPYSWDSKWTYKCKAEIKTDDQTQESSDSYGYSDIGDYIPDYVY
ncbi:MAG: leucine-rich repeat protein [Clostridia bacterium]|nr:leucine-rich repeat protein [Clostridia bacterium]